MTDLGGIYQCLTLIILFINSPVSKFSFLLKAIKRIYLARTKEDYLFKKIKNKKI